VVHQKDPNTQTELQKRQTKTLAVGKCLLNE